MSLKKILQYENDIINLKESIKRCQNDDSIGEKRQAIRLKVTAINEMKESLSRADKKTYEVSKMDFTGNASKLLETAFFNRECKIYPI